MAVHLLSFGDPYCRVARRRLLDQATAFSLFSTVRILSRSNLSPEFVTKHRSRLSILNRGYGFWIWKPRVILDSLLEVADRDIVVYVDVGCHLNKHGNKKMTEYLEKVSLSSSGILSSEYCEEEAKWTKGDVLDYFNVRLNAEVVNSRQRQSGVIFLRNEERTRKFVSDWLEIMEAFPNFIDDSPSSSANFPSFVQHRHDQSIFSIMSKLYGGEVFPGWDIEPWLGRNPPESELSFPVLAKRDFRDPLWSMVVFARKLVSPQLVARKMISVATKFGARAPMKG